MSERQAQQEEPTETEIAKAQETGWSSSLAFLAFGVAILSITFSVLLFVLFSFPFGLVGTDCPCGPSAEMATHPTSYGYELEIASTCETCELNAWKVAVLKDGTPWFWSPKVVWDGAIGTGPAGEYLNFTDLTGDDELTDGDFFTLENLTSGSTYEVILLRATDDNKIASEVITVP